MKTLLLYYSFTGNTRRFAEKLASETGAELFALKDAKPLSKLRAFTSGVVAAMRQKPANLHPFSANLPAYDKIIIAMPIWAGHPAPPIHNILAQLPAGKEVELYMLSGSGHSGGSAEKIKALVTANGCTVTGYHDIKA